MSKSHRTSYDEATTGRCERALVTLLGDIGPWRERVYLAGGLVFRPKGERVGSKLGALNIRGAHLVRDDFVEHAIEGVRLDDGGVSRVAVRVANLLPYAVLKSFAFQERHENKDAYDLIFTILNAREEPVLAGEAAALSPVAGHPHAVEALALLEERFANVEQDGPRAYSNFLADADDEDDKARLRQEAVATVRTFIRGFRYGAGTLLP